MSSRCCVVICKNKGGSDISKKRGISFHMFPRNLVLRQKWIDATGQRHDWQPDSAYYKICSEHFKEKCFQKLDNIRRLCKGAIPTLNLRYGPDPLTRKAPGEKCQHVLVPKDICSRCKKVFYHRGTGAQDQDRFLGDQAKAIIAQVHEFFQGELTEMKKKYGDTIDYHPFTKFEQRTSEATGVGLSTVRKILKEANEWNEKRRKKRRQMLETSTIELDECNNECNKTNCDSENQDENTEIQEHGTIELDECNNECNKTNCDSENQDENTEIQEHGTQTERDTTDTDFDINDNNITILSDIIIRNGDSPTTETQQEVSRESQSCSLEPIDLSITQRTNIDIENQSVNTAEAEFSGTQTEPYTDANQNDTTQRYGLQADKEIGTLETEDVEFEYLDVETYDDIVNQSDTTDTSLVMGGPQYYEYSLDTINPMMNPLNGRLMSTEPQYCSLETMNPAGPHPLVTNEPHFYSLEPYLNPIMGQLVPSEPHYCSMDSTMNAGTFMGPSNLVHMDPSTQPLISTEPQYMCSMSADCQTMAARYADYTAGLNYYVIL